MNCKGAFVRTLLRPAELQWNRCGGGLSAGSAEFVRFTLSASIPRGAALQLRYAVVPDAAASSGLDASPAKEGSVVPEDVMAALADAPSHFFNRASSGRASISVLLPAAAYVQVAIVPISCCATAQPQLPSGAAQAAQDAQVHFIRVNGSPMTASQFEWRALFVKGDADVLSQTPALSKLCNILQSPLLFTSVGTLEAPVETARPPAAGCSDLIPLIPVVAPAPVLGDTQKPYADIDTALSSCTSETFEEYKNCVLKNYKYSERDNLVSALVDCNSNYNGYKSENFYSCVHLWVHREQCKRQGLQPPQCPCSGTRAIKIGAVKE